MSKKIYAVPVACLLALLTSHAQAWTIQHDYDSQSVDQKCADFTDTNSSVTNTKSSSGAMSCKNIIGAGETAFGKWGGVVAFPRNLVKNDEIWIRIRTFMPAGFDFDSNGEGEHLKFLRVHTRDASNENFGYNDWYISPKKYSSDRINNEFSHEFIYEGAAVPAWSYVTDMSKAPQLDVWETYEYYLKLDSVPASKGGQARIRAWKNNELILDVADKQTLKHAGAYADRMHLFTYWNGGSPKTQEMYIDDLFITTAPPSTTDASGNRFIGDAAIKSPPNAPTVNQ